MASLLNISHNFGTLSLARQCCISTLKTSRALHVSQSRHDLVAPPDPVSHMRPILYDNPPSQLPAQYLRHPYSLSEFKTESSDNRCDHELQFKLLRQQLDSLHQDFWLDSNTRFYSAKEVILSSLPKNATVRDKEEALSVFLKQWVVQENERTDAYTAEWRSRNVELIQMGARVEYHRLKTRLAKFFKRQDAA